MSLANLIGVSSITRKASWMRMDVEDLEPPLTNPPWTSMMTILLFAAAITDKCFQFLDNFIAKHSHCVTRCQELGGEVTLMLCPARVRIMVPGHFSPTWQVSAVLRM